MATAQAPIATPAAANRAPRHRRARRGAHRGGFSGQNEVAIGSAQPVELSVGVPIGSNAADPSGRPVQMPQSGRGNGRRGAFGPSRIRDPSLALRPASVISDSNQGSAQDTQSNRGNYGRRGGPGRGGRRGGAQLIVNGGRAFGGQLTSSLAEAPDPSLAADAPEFVPGQPIVSRARQPLPKQQPRTRRFSKSQAPDISTRTHEDIAGGNYECVICTNEVRSNSKIWNCKTCWSVLHLTCVKRWAKNESSTLLQRALENGELPPPRQWRCPGCNLPKTTLPETYTCWCEKEVEPHSIPGLPPHSCGQSCSKPRVGQCPHPCLEICHAGPCKPCQNMGPTLSCFCGKEESARRCVDTNYESGWSCGQICDEVLPCGEHTCSRGCHAGVCGSCEVPIDSKCYCGRVEKSLPCSERDDEEDSELAGETWTGSFSCGAVCRRAYDCENHFCESLCHSQTLLPAHCPFSPDMVTTCPCGKTLLDDLLTEPRSNCSARIPHCKETCNKTLPCGHSCPKTCHADECPPCFQTMQIACRCGRTVSNTACHQGIEEPPHCSRICRTTLNCGRHECSDRCCPGEKKGGERQASRRKHRALNAPAADDNIESEHICLKVCGRPLKCGNHTCQSLCHKGPCGTCLEAIFEEISCACGKTILQPPQACGTKAPECRFDCTRRRTCGHPQIKHQCHQDIEPCPKCPFLVEKQCLCSKKTLKNQPCWFSEVRCGLACGKKLKCGSHFCQKQCHRPGECEDADTACTQACGRKKTVCDHFDPAPCHAPYPCKEDSPCQAKTFITCACQHQKQAIKCLASKTSAGNTGKTLDCDDECLRIQRNAKLAAALNIDPATHTDDHIPYSQTTLSYFTEHVKWCQQQEREFRVFAADENEKRLRFKPMQAAQRAFMHSLAEDFGLDSESQDPEPHRHTVVFKTPRFVASPMKTLAQCVKIKPVLAEPTAPPAKALVSSAEPFNGFLLSNPKFGLTIDELQTQLKPEFAEAGLEFDVSFLPSGDVVVRALPDPAGSWVQTQKPDASLAKIKDKVQKKVLGCSLASAAVLCALDSSLNVLRKEDDKTETGGWSQVAKGASGARRPVQESVGSKSSFTVLGTRRKEKKVVTPPEEVVDDWEMAE